MVYTISISLSLILHDSCSNELYNNAKRFSPLCGWYTWKSINDLRFNNKKWTIKRVHLETNADMYTSTCTFYMKIDEEQITTSLIPGDQ